MNKELKEKFDLLTKPIWGIKDILTYFNNAISMPTALRMKKKALEVYNGAFGTGTKYVLRDAFLMSIGTSSEAELSKLKILIDEDKELDNNEKEL